jgi:GNAT superfamily N-acetyltransferase
MESSKNQEVIVRQAVLDDLDSICHLFDQYRQFQGITSDIAAGRKFLGARMRNSESVVFVALLDQAPIGFAQLYPVFSSTALARVFILNDLFVGEQGRRYGIATQLLRAVEAFAWTSGASSVRLNVKRDNRSAQMLYENAGWLRDQDFFMYQQFPTGETS